MIGDLSEGVHVWWANWQMQIDLWTKIFDLEPIVFLIQVGDVWKGQHLSNFKNLVSLIVVDSWNSHVSLEYELFVMILGK